MDCVSDILYHDKVQRLTKYEQHCHTSRLQHCINVSYYSFLVCRKFGWDYRSAARGAPVSYTHLVRLERIMTRDGLTYSQAEKRIFAQKSDEEYRAMANRIILNNGGLEELGAELDQLWNNKEGK